MSEIIAVVVILLMIISVFVPMAYLEHTTINTEEVKHSLNLSAKVLANSMEEGMENMENLQQGFMLEDFSSINIDKDKLSADFYEILNRNFYDKQKFDRLQNSILLRALVQRDKFFIAQDSYIDSNGVKHDIWGPPLAFTETLSFTLEGGTIVKRLCYLNTKDTQVYFYEDAGDKTLIDIKYYNKFQINSKLITGISIEKSINNGKFNGAFNPKIKNDIIIYKINDVISQYTYKKGVRDGLKIEIRNPDDPGVQKDSLMYSNINVLGGGITFFVIYGENTEFGINMQEVKYKNYNVVGFTLAQ